MSLPVDGVDDRPTVVDLYAGAGGLSLGMEQAGFRVALAAELDPIHAMTHRFNFPHTPVLHGDLGAGEVEEVAEHIRRATGVPHEIDAVVGGPPCQGFSVGGLRQAGDPRNGQLLRFVELVLTLRPKVFCLENVAGLLQPQFQHVRATALTMLNEGGYDVRGLDHVHNAASFGVPQSRRRVFVLGSRVGRAPNLEPVSEKLVSVEEALRDVPNASRFSSLLRHDEVELSAAARARMEAEASPYARLLAGLSKSSSDLSVERNWDRAILTNSLRTVHSREVQRRFAATPPGSVEPVSRLYRLKPSSQARTLRAGTGVERGSHTSPRPIHPYFNRVITVREAARLHGYPDWFRFHSTNWHGHRQVGNSVPPPLAAAAGRALVEALGRRTSVSAPDRTALGDPRWLRLNRSDAEALLAGLH